jgi:hypothetical protein
MALPTDITATRFNQRLYQVQRKNHFEVTFDGTMVDPGLSLMVTSFSLPKETTDTFKANYFNDSVNLTGKTNFETGNLVIKDAINYDTEKQFQRWRLRVYNPKTGKVGYAEDFKCNAVVKEYSPSGDIVREWTLIGCFPSSVDYGDVTYEDAGEKTITATIMYDKGYRSDIDEYAPSATA